MKMKVKSNVKENSSTMNPHKTRRQTLPAAAKGVGPKTMNKGGKKK